VGPANLGKAERRFLQQAIHGGGRGLGIDRAGGGAGRLAIVTSATPPMITALAVSVRADSGSPGRPWSCQPGRAGRQPLLRGL
jgi:hypothetical protein